MVRIAEIHVYQKDLPVKEGPYTMSGQEVWQLDTTIVRLVGDNGVTGWGEVCPVGPLYAPVQAGGIRASLRDLAPALIGVAVEPLTVQRAIDTAICGHMGATVSPKLLEAIWLSTPYQAETYGPDAPVTVIDGHVNLPEGPGLGINPDPGQFGQPVFSIGG